MRQIPLGPPFGGRPRKRGNGPTGGRRLDWRRGAREDDHDEGARQVLRDLVNGKVGYGEGLGAAELEPSGRVEDNVVPDADSAREEDVLDAEALESAVAREGGVDEREDPPPRVD